LRISRLEPVSVRVEHRRYLEKRNFGVVLLGLFGKTARQLRASTNGGNGFSCHRPPSYSSKEAKKARPNRRMDEPSDCGEFFSGLLPGTARGSLSEDHGRPVSLPSALAA